MDVETVVNADQPVVVRLKGDITHSEIQSLASVLWIYVEEGNPRLVFNLAEVTSTGSSFLDILAELGAACQEYGGDLRLVAIPESEDWEWLTRSRFQRFSTEEEAVSSFPSVFRL